MKIRTAIWAGLVGMIPISLFAQNERAMARKGNQAYQSGNYSKAEVQYKKSLKKAKDFNEAKFNLGNALVRQGRYEQAAKKFGEVVKNSDKQSVEARAYHNKGNAYLNAKKYRKSVNAYKNALRKNPGDKDSRYNLSYALKKLEEKQKQNKQNKNNKKQNKKDQEKQKQNKKDQEKKGKNQEKQKSEDKKENQKGENQQKGEQSNEQQKKAQQSGKQKQKVDQQEMMRMLKAIESGEEEIQRKVLKKKRKGRPSDEDQKNW